MPPSNYVVGCRWIFKTKRRADGSLEQQKARPMAKGYHQLPGVDYIERFNPVVKTTTVWLILSLAVTALWPIHQLDNQNTFLHREITEFVFMSQPPIIHHPDLPDYLCLLHKALYSLKQAPRAWFH